ncbi:hypothetical protein C0Q70_15701 [Pomacea canaliculata]|uniref:Uncharacterized protein n=1 Tax=Pomacea canaliculata TaxID=400727 RepID=A0A2T7NVL0_POMCA|nr:hypothetical protein C0Q70_15701 [Pomacea canaliculata]
MQQAGQSSSVIVWEVMTCMAAETLLDLSGVRTVILCLLTVAPAAVAIKSNIKNIKDQATWLSLAFRSVEASAESDGDDEDDVDSDEDSLEDTVLAAEDYTRPFDDKTTRAGSLFPEENLI